MKDGKWYIAGIDPANAIGISEVQIYGTDGKSIWPTPSPKIFYAFSPGGHIKRFPDNWLGRLSARLWRLWIGRHRRVNRVHFTCDMLPGAAKDQHDV